MSDWSSDVCSSELEQHRPLKIGQRSVVVVDDRQTADARRREILDHRRAYATRADHRHARFQQPRLSRATDFLQDDVARITVELFVAERHFTSASRPVEPKPPSPRPVSSSSATSAKRPCCTAAGTSCALPSPRPPSKGTPHPPE